MLAWLIASVSTFVYVVGAMVGVRVIHVRRSVEWMRWKNEDPDKTESYYGGEFPYYPLKKSRKNTTLYEYVKYVASYNKMSRPMALLWPFFGPYYLAKKFMFPDVKMPDQAKIKELEDL